MEKNHGFATWGDEFSGKRGEKALQKAYSLTTDYRAMVHHVPGCLPFMVHRDVAAIYHVETRALMQQVKRNQAHFDEDMVFELTKGQVEDLISQNVISPEALGRGATIWAFTRMGANHVAYFLRSAEALARAKQISKAFVHFEDLHQKGELPGGSSLGPGLLASGVFQRYGLSISDVAAICWFRDKNLTQVEVARICCITQEKVKRVEKTLRDAGITLAPVIANKRARQMWQFFTRLVGVRDGVPLLKGGTS